MLGRSAGWGSFVGGNKGVFLEKEETGDFVDEAEVIVDCTATAASEAEFSSGLIGKIFPWKGSFTAGAATACSELPAAAVPVRAW